MKIKASIKVFHFHFLCATIIFSLLSSPVSAQMELISINPVEPTAYDNVTLYLTNTCGFNETLIQRDTVTRKLKVYFYDLNFLPCEPPEGTPLDIGNLLSFPGVWDVSVYRSSGGAADRLDPLNEVFTTQITINQPKIISFHETPVEGSIESGVGLIRGWACDAQSVELSIDGGERIKVAYGTGRNDTLEVCGDTNNGYGLVVNWASMSEGVHQMQTYINNQKISDIEFSVVNIGEEFSRGIDAVYELKDFPYIGESVEIKWSQPAQNFVIINHEK